MLRSHFTQKRALGCDITLLIVADEHWPYHTLLNSLWEQVVDFDERFSRFKKTSELTALNEHAGVQFEASSMLIDLTKLSIQLSKSTAGYFNPLILPALQRAGYKVSLENSLPGVDYTKRSVLPASEIVIKGSHITLPANTAIDFGGIGKGYLADVLADQLDTVSGLSGYWLSVGGDIVCKGFDESSRTWKVNIQSAASPESDCAYIELPPGRTAIASSGTFARTGVSEGKSWHHIIDPRTLESSESDIKMSTVAYSRCAIADALATCALLSGSENVSQLLSTHRVDDYYMQLIDDTYVLHGTNIKRYN